jgi:2-keto-4-pentenoate hydratase
MTPEAAARAAEILARARAEKTAIRSLPPDVRPRNLMDAYQIQDKLVGLIDDFPIGWKVGATSETAQRHLRVPGPFCGRMFDKTRKRSEAKFQRAQFLSFCLIEPEFAFRLGSALMPRKAAYGRNEVGSAIASVHPAIEIVDSRYTDWLTVGTPSIIADNAAHGAFVYGRGITDWQALDLRSQQVQLYRNGQVVARGFGQAALGDPLNVVVWLANHLSQREERLPAGSFVSTGIVTDVTFAETGDEFMAEFGPLGRVSVAFGE